MNKRISIVDDEPDITSSLKVGLNIMNMMSLKLIHSMTL
jgi:hypothetical protein